MTSKRVVLAVFLAAFVLGGVSIVLAQEGAEKPAAEKPGATKKEGEKAAFTLTGAKQCKMCHAKEAAGNQYGKWEASPHAKAYATLASEKSIAKGKEMGLKKPPQESPECLKCHVTAFPVMGDLANQKITLEEGVSCESCHGPASGYWKKTVMTQLYNDEIEPASVGLWEVTEETCVKCHNKENPFHTEFVFKERVAKIAHSYPEGYVPK
jgi:hypothetical protein